MPSKWISKSFSVHLDADADLMPVINGAAERGKLSELVREAIRFYVQWRKQARQFDMAPVMEELGKLNRRVAGLETLIKENGLELTEQPVQTEDAGMASDLQDLLDNL